MVAALERGAPEEAYRIARATNPFASSCGHGCHAPCETACRRRRQDSPVAISSLEAFAASFATPAPVAPDGACSTAFDRRSVSAASGAARSAVAEGTRVVIVGGGAAGLSCAHDLALLGHRPLILDAGHEPGGVLTRTLPSFRFPTSAAIAECLTVLASGVEYRAGMQLAGAGALEELFTRGFGAVFLAIGSWKRPHDPRLSHARDALEVLADDHPLEGDVVVFGRGELAVDTAREIAHRARARGLVQRTDLVLSTRLEESAIPPESIAAAMREGISVHAGWLLARLRADARGRTTGVEITRDGGRGSRILSAVHVVDAGARVPDAEAFALALDGSGHVAVDPDTLQTSHPRVWAGGACAFGHRSIAHAVADGRRAAWEIHAALTGTSRRQTLIAHWVEADRGELSMDSPAVKPRQLMPCMASVPTDPFSSSAQPPAELIMAEARRCYDCTVLPLVQDGCTGCGDCVKACYPLAISLVGAPRRAQVDPDLCTRCGACEDSCPEDAITMARASWEERLAFDPGVASVAAQLTTPADPGKVTPL
jgi:formate dehydrogenase (NADP+) beta subunit